MKLKHTLSALAIVLGLMAGDALQGGLKGGGGPRGGPGGAGPGSGPRSGGESPAAAARPSAPQLGGAGGLTPSRPNLGQPTASRPAVNRPAGGGRGIASQPQINRGAGGGFKPPTMANRPSTPARPANPLGGGLSGIANRPNVPQPGGRPGVSPHPGNNRPSFPNLGSSGLAGALNRPGVGNAGLAGINRPSFPGAGNVAGAGNRPGINLPNRPGPGGGIADINRPGFPGGAGRPSTGGDFLGLDRSQWPGAGGSGLQRPGLDRTDLANRIGSGAGGIQRPGVDNRPGVANLPGAGGIQRPGINNRPGIANWPGAGGAGTQWPGRDRVGYDGSRYNGSRYDRSGLRSSIDLSNVYRGNNNIINNRPSWANLDNNRYRNINANWGNQLGGLSNWGARNPDRLGYWGGWGNGVRDHYRGLDYNWFGNDWWQNHNHNWSGWHYGNSFNNYPASYWWQYPSYSDATNWFSDSSQSWSNPVYYDYGSGGNVVYQDDAVYIDGQPVCTAEEFAQSAAALATVAPPASEELAAQAEWLPLGTFAVSTNQKDVDPTRVLQLAVNKQGVISGTAYNPQTDQALSVQGQVDAQTQRVAFRAGDNENFIVETGLYNLTQEYVPILVHYGAEKVEQWLLVRLDNPANQQAGQY